jgi:hypothetical protein
MNDLFVWIKDAFNSRFGSIMYGTFILTWLTTNRKFRFISFFINEQYIRDKYWFLKNEYIINLYSFHDFWSFIWISSKLILIPAVVTYLVHRWIYKIEKRVYAKWLANKTERKIIKIKEDEKYQRAISKVESEKSKNLNIQERNLAKESKIKQAKIKSQEEILEEEYNNLKNQPLFFSSMGELKFCLYSKNSVIKDYNGITNIRDISLWFLDANWLITLEDNKVFISAKGKFFMKKFINN